MSHIHSKKAFELIVQQSENYIVLLFYIWMHRDNNHLATIYTM